MNGRNRSDFRKGPEQKNQELNTAMPTEAGTNPFRPCPRRWKTLIDQRKEGYMAKIKKTIKAGPLVKTVLYTAPEPRDGPQARAEKSRATTAARKWINDKTARGKMEMLLWANFTERDLYVTLTYDDAHLPKNRKEAQENVRKFILTSQGALEKGRGGITLYLL